jgi:hypothetical protein
VGSPGSWYTRARVADPSTTDATILFVGPPGSAAAVADELTRRGAMVESATLEDARDVAFVLAPDLIVIAPDAAPGGGTAALERLRSESLHPVQAFAVVVTSADERRRAEAAGARACVWSEAPERLGDNLLRVIAGEPLLPAPDGAPAADSSLPKPAPVRPVVPRPGAAALAPASHPKPRTPSVPPRPASVPPPSAFASPDEEPAPAPTVLAASSRNERADSTPVVPAVVLAAKARTDPTPVVAVRADGSPTKPRADQTPAVALPLPPGAVPSPPAKAELARPEAPGDWRDLPSFGLGPAPAAPLPAIEADASSAGAAAPPASPAELRAAPSERPQAPSGRPWWAAGAALLVLVGLLAWLAARPGGPAPTSATLPSVPPGPPPSGPAEHRPDEPVADEPPEEPEAPEAALPEPAPSSVPLDLEALPPRERIDRLILQANYNRTHDGPARAEEDYRAVLEIDPRNQRALVGLTRLATARGNHAAALEWAERLTTEHPRVASNFVVLGDARAASGDREGARQAYEEALAISPGLALAQSRLEAL